MPDSRDLHEERYKATRAAGEPGWGGAERVARLRDVLKERFFAFEHVPLQGRLLELGCGAGNLSFELAPLGYEVHGIDFSESAIAWAKDKAKQTGIRADFQAGSVTDLSAFAPASFDVVYDGNCLHCVIGGDRARVYREVLRVIKPKGIFFVSSLCSADSDPAFPENFNAGTRILSEHGVPYRYIPTAEILRGELLSAGFTILKQAERHDSPFGHINFHAGRAE